MFFILKPRRCLWMGAKCAKCVTKANLQSPQIEILQMLAHNQGARAHKCASQVSQKILRLYLKRPMLAHLAHLAHQER